MLYNVQQRVLESKHVCKGTGFFLFININFASVLFCFFCLVTYFLSFYTHIRYVTLERNDVFD